MARKERRDNSKLRELMEEYGVKTMEDVQNFIKMLTAETIQTALDAELESELGMGDKNLGIGYDMVSITWTNNTYYKCNCST